ncbi:MAG: MFS transporter [bacterium]
MNQLTVLSIVASLHFVSWHLVSPYIALVAKGQGAGTDTIGLIMAAYAVLPMVVSVPTGVICDRTGTRKLFISSTVGIAVGSCSLLVSRSVNFLAASLAALGLFHVLQSVATQVTIAHSGDENIVYRNFAVYSFCSCVAHLIAPPLGGLLVREFGYGTLFAVSASLAVLMLVFTPLMKEIEPRKSLPKVSNAWEVTRRSVQTLLHKPAFVISLLGIFGIIVLYSLRTSFYSVYFDEANLSPPMIGLLLTVQGAAEMAIRPFTISWRNQFGPAPTLLVALAACAGSALLTPWFKSVGVLALVLGLGGVGYGLAHPITMGLASQAADDGERGLAMGLRMFANRLSGLVAPLFLGKMGNVFDIKAIFAAAAGAIVSCLVVVYIWAKVDNSLWLPRRRQASPRTS